MGYLSFVFFLVGFILAYFIWVRPLLQARPLFAEFYERENSFWLAIGGKLKSLKTRLASTFLMVSSSLVGLHDFLLPMIPGIDWDPITSKLPTWVWPIVFLSIGAGFRYLRNLTMDAQKVDVQAAVDEVVMKVEAGESVSNLDAVNRPTVE